MKKITLDELKEALTIKTPVKVVDVGANPIDGKPPYFPLYSTDNAFVVGFEPDESAFDKLQKAKKKKDKFFKLAVGDGTKLKFNVCKFPGMSSNLDPDLEVMNRFQMYPIAAEILQTVEMETTRLDNVKDAKGADMLKIDVQGSELRIFQNGVNTLKDMVLVHTEAMFVPIYKDQPLFADQDMFLREQGFAFHTILEPKKRAYHPLVIGGDIRNGLNQICTVDVVYFAGWDKMQKIAPPKLLKLALILDTMYGSYDLAQAVLKVYDERQKTKIWDNYMQLRGFA